MSDDNIHNILFFESSSMKELYNSMKNWQRTNQKRFLSMCIEKDMEKFCCIALTNPSEVTIVGGYGENSVQVTRGNLCVKQYG